MTDLSMPRCDIEELKEENKQLKELLKECKPYLKYNIFIEKHVGFTPKSANVLQEINAAIGESEG